MSRRHRAVREALLSEPLRRDTKLRVECSKHVARDAANQGGYSQRLTQRLALSRLVAHTAMGVDMASKPTCIDEG